MTKFTDYDITSPSEKTNLARRDKKIYFQMKRIET
jgi:hypothetical protein